MEKKSRLKLIKNQLTHEERIQNRIDAFREDILDGDGNMEYVQQILHATLEYLSQYEDDDIYCASVKVKESLFYVNNFINYE